MKHKEWEGYFTTYFKKALAKEVSPIEILNREWYDGIETAKIIFPYITKNSVVLEIGCGLGRVSKYIAPECRKLYCTDIIEEALSEVKNNLKEFNNVIYNLINGYDLKNFDENFFDCVYSFTTFFHFDFELVVNYFREIRRVLKPGGVAVIEFKRWRDEKDVLQLIDKIEKRGGIERYEKDLDKWRYVSKEILIILCEYYNLTIVDDNLTCFTFKKNKE